MAGKTTINITLSNVACVQMKQSYYMCSGMSTCSAGNMEGATPSASAHPSPGLVARCPHCTDKCKLMEAHTHKHTQTHTTHTQTHWHKSIYRILFQLSLSSDYVADPALLEPSYNFPR